jgi:hypothetical protein
LAAAKAHPVGDGGDAVHLAQDRFFDQLPVNHDQARIGGLEFRDDAACPRDGLRARGEHLIEGGDLPGMDGALARKAQIARLFGGVAHPVHVIEVEPRHVDHVEPGTCGGVHDTGPGVEERLPRVLAPQLGGHVDAAEKQRVDPVRGSGRCHGRPPAPHWFR